MPTITKHAQGTFSWPELGVPNQAAAKKFYSAVFGWGVKDYPMPPEAGGGAYTIFQVDGKDVCACYHLSPDMQSQGMPANWGAYVTVDNADAAVKKCEALGGKLLMGPMDVMGTLGRMAVLQDPTGATFSVWQAGDHIGAQVLDEAGALIWTELMTSDTAKCASFYTQLLGYTTQVMPMEDSHYTIFVCPDGKRAAGMMAFPPNMTNVPPNWTSYFGTKDIRGTVAKIEQAGGKVCMPVTPIPGVGEFAVVQDDQNAVFALLQPSM